MMRAPGLALYVIPPSQDRQEPTKMKSETEKAEMKTEATHMTRI